MGTLGMVGRQGGREVDRWMSIPSLRQEPTLCMSHAGTYPACIVARTNSGFPHILTSATNCQIESASSANPLIQSQSKLANPASSCSAVGGMSEFEVRRRRVWDPPLSLLLFLLALQRQQQLCLFSGLHRNGLIKICRQRKKEEQASDLPSRVTYLDHHVEPYQSFSEVTLLQTKCLVKICYEWKCELEVWRRVRVQQTHC